MDFQSLAAAQLQHRIEIGKLLAADFLGRALNAVVERLLIDRNVNGTGKVVTWSSKTLRLVQTGNTGFYIFAKVISIIILLVVNSFI